MFVFFCFILSFHFIQLESLGHFLPARMNESMNQEERSLRKMLVYHYFERSFHPPGIACLMCPKVK